MLNAVKERYSKAALESEKALCCPVEYDGRYLEQIPPQVLERDYGCGDPTPYLREGDSVLDLGSGSGKICYIASQVVGARGKIIGVDMTSEMLELARRHLPEFSERIGYENIEFRHGYIQDLKTDLDWMDDYLKSNPVNSAEDYKRLAEHIDSQRRENPLVADNSVDVIVSNCVLNLVDDSLKPELFGEMYRVLKPGGRIAVSDIVSDEKTPQKLKDDPELWSGCVSGALQEYEFLRLLEEKGFYGIAVDRYEEKPWQVVEGIEYRSAIITAYKGKEGECIEKNQAVIYKGPWKKVEDDDGHVLLRGQRMAVCEKTFRIYGKEPYSSSIIPVPPTVEVTEELPFDCGRSDVRSPEETKKGVRTISAASAAEGCADPYCC